MKTKKELNEKTIQEAQPGDILRDAKITGLELRALATKKVFYLYYRTKDGTQRHPKIGDYPTIRLSKAREIAQEWLAEVACGGDPSANNKKAREALTVAEAWAEFESGYLDPDPKTKRKGLKTAKEYKRCFNVYVPQSIKSAKVATVSDDDMKDLHRKLGSTPYQANRVIAFLQSFFQFLIDEKKYIPKGANPCETVTRYPEPKRRRYAEAAEIREIAKLLQQKRAANPQSVAFIYLLILTGARSGEIAKARWCDLRGNKLVLTEHKTDRTLQERVIRLAPDALDIIDSLPRRQAHQTIVGIKSPKKLWETIWEKTCENLYEQGLELSPLNLRLNDLRHSFASVALSAGYTLAQIGELLGHTSEQTTQRYAHLIEEQAEKAAADVVDGIRKRMSITP